MKCVEGVLKSRDSSAQEKLARGKSINQKEPFLLCFSIRHASDQRGVRCQSDSQIFLGADSWSKSQALFSHLERIDVIGIGGCAPDSRLLLSRPYLMSKPCFCLFISLAQI